MNESGLACEGVGAMVAGRWLLRSADLVFAPGQVTAIVGPNGAGKSTLLSLLSGERPPQHGTVRLDGVPLPRIAAPALALRRAVMAQDTAVSFDFLVREVVELGRYPHRRRPSADEAGLLREAMALTGVEALAERGFSSLSGGEKARAQLARVLAQLWSPVGDGSRWLLLDEPTAALDLAHQHQALGLVRARAQGQGLGVVVVLHDLNLALRYADRAVLLADAAVQASGPVAEVLTPARVHATWGVAAVATGGPDGQPQFVFGPGP